MMLATKEDKIIVAALIDALTTAVYDDGFFIEHREDIEGLANTIMTKAKEVGNG